MPLWLSRGLWQRVTSRVAEILFYLYWLTKYTPPWPEYVVTHAK